MRNYLEMEAALPEDKRKDFHDICESYSTRLNLIKESREGSKSYVDYTLEASTYEKQLIPFIEEISTVFPLLIRDALNAIQEHFIGEESDRGGS